MSEHQPAPMSYAEFLDEIHPATVEDMKEVEKEAADDYCRLGCAEYWLRENHNNPLANPDHRLYYEHIVEQVAKKLEHPYG